MSTHTLIGLAVIGAILIYGISIYNQLVSLKNRFKNGFAQIDVQLQRRHDLIPNLVETARTFLKHERETLESVMQARQQAVSASQTAAHDPADGEAIKALGKAESTLNRALANLYAVAENYPDLKSNQTMSQLMEELTSTENKVGFARQAYNDSVMQYHTYREQFPSNLIAGFFGFKATEMLQVDDPNVRRAVKVNFN
ncbi:MAG: LemA family protein [Hahellaceae bacterium]|nr:LemA family protein [Hahellaceae bacterium]